PPHCSSLRALATPARIAARNAATNRRLTAATRRSETSAARSANAVALFMRSKLGRKSGETVKAGRKMPSCASCPRMRPVIDVEQPRAVDAGIDLRRRQAGVAQQFLDRAQVAAIGEQMRGEGMAQGVRRRRIRQVERAAQ